MEELLWFAITYIFIYFVFYILILNNKKSLEKYKTSKEVTYIVKKYHLNLDKINFKKFANTLFLLNDVIISLTISIVLSRTNNILLIILLSILILIPLILIGYCLIGKHYKRKEDQYV